MRGLGALLIFGVLAAGCGGGSASYDEPRTLPRETEAELSRHERRIAELEPVLASTVCEERCAAAGDICEAAERICAIADGLGDPSVLARCERAAAVCRQARESGSECCEAPAAPWLDRHPGGVSRSE